MISKAASIDVGSDRDYIARAADAAWLYDLPLLRRLLAAPLARVHQGACLVYPTVDALTACTLDCTLATFGLAERRKEEFYGDEPYKRVGVGDVYRITDKGRRVLEEIDRREWVERMRGGKGVVANE